MMSTTLRKSLWHLSGRDENGNPHRVCMFFFAWTNLCRFSWRPWCWISTAVLQILFYTRLEGVWIFLTVSQLCLRSPFELSTIKVQWYNLFLVLLMLCITVRFRSQHYICVSKFVTHLSQIKAAFQSLPLMQIWYSISRFSLAEPLPTPQQQNPVMQAEDRL